MEEYESGIVLSRPCCASSGRQALRWDGMGRKAGLPGTAGGGSRDWMEISRAILEMCLPGKLKTHVMYGCSLNTRQASGYLDFLGSNGLLEEAQSTGKRIYRTTEKGRKYIRAYRQLEGVFL